MTFAFKLSYCKASIPDEAEFRQGKKRASLSFELSVVCDPQTLHLISLVVIALNDFIRPYVVSARQTHL